MKRIREAIQGALDAEGFQQSIEGAPDFYVVYHWSTESKVEVDYDGDGWFARRYPGDSAFGTTVIEYEEGTLVIDFLDGKSREIFWRGTGTRRINTSSSPQQSTETLQKWVNRILKQYPPLEKGSKPVPSGCSFTPQRFSYLPQQS